jgi:hypothetical protein
MKTGVSTILYNGYWILFLALAACQPQDETLHLVQTQVATSSPALTPSSSPFPTLLEFPAEQANIRFNLGEPEIVFDYSRDTCRRAVGYDLPDTPARAVRTPDGNIVLVSSGPPYNFLMYGPNFDELQHSCEPAFITGDSPDAFTFDNQSWLISLYRQGDTIHALVHNEYHDPYAANCLPGVTTPENLCWYNAINYAASSDGGHTFQRPAPPTQLVAALPIPWDPTAYDTTQPARPRAVRRPNPYGYMGASNIVSGPDGYYYALFRSLPDPLGKNPGGTCLMRTSTLGEPSSWRAWDGSGFNLTMFSPYDEQGNPAPTGLSSCTYVSPENTMEMTDSLTYNTFLQRYILIGAGVRDITGRLTCGTFYTLSSDLIHWSEPRLILEHLLPFPPCIEPGALPNGSKLYPSVIDHDQTDVNFEYSDDSFYLYYVLWNEGLDRDLWRMPVSITIEP